MFYIRKDSMMKKQSFTHSRKPKFGMRKLSIGLASCMLGMMFLATGHVSAEDVDHVGETITVVPEQRSNWNTALEKRKAEDNVTATLWVSGVDMRGVEFKNVKDESSDYFVSEHQKGRGYYDINKRLDGRDSSLC